MILLEQRFTRRGGIKDGGLTTDEDWKRKTQTPSEDWGTQTMISSQEGGGRIQGSKERLSEAETLRRSRDLGMIEFQGARPPHLVKPKAISNQKV